jgi:beta-glucanase (GH16 family)
MQASTIKTRGLQIAALAGMSLGILSCGGGSKCCDFPQSGSGGGSGHAGPGSGGAAGGSAGSGATAGSGGGAAGGASAGAAGTGAAGTGAAGTGTAGSGSAGSGAAGAGGRGGAAGNGNADAGNDGPRDAGAVTDGAPQNITTDGGAWHLVWSDEFDTDGAPSASNWNYEKGFVRNQELQWYQPANATVANGILTIAAQQVHIANPNYNAGSSDWKQNRQYYDYTSTSMTTSGKHTFTYGRFEARARIDVRQGSWPAFWVVGTSGGWPAGGEVDIMEFYASKVLANVCKPAGSTCNWSSNTKSVSSLGGASWASQFHVWAMEWDATTIDLYLDDVLMNHFNVADAVAAGTTNPYVGRSLYFIVNLAIGANGGDPSGTTFPITYEVDYVRVYQH